MIDKVVASIEEAVADIPDGAHVMIGGFGRAGQPVQLIDALIEQGASGLTVISNNAGNGDVGLARLIQLGRVAKMICSFPRQNDSWHFDAAYREGRLELELVPQGNLVERIRAAGAGIPAFYTPTGVGTLLYEGAETREFDGREYVLVPALHADFALVQGYRADRLGNVQYRKTARNFGPPMATAARTTIVQVDEVVEVGALDPEAIPTPGIFVDRVVPVGWRDWTPGGVYVGGLVDVNGEALEQGIDPLVGETKATEGKPSGTEGTR
ncbi:MAG: 3-oxoacid CoA-transferase subunit A [Microbacteriaceae bacterium]|nr:3-oxoacid CoA-transferase subunit A [Microbacteriaceae bacterium]